MTPRSCSPVGGSRSRSRLIPRLTRMRCTVAGATVHRGAAGARQRGGRARTWSAAAPSSPDPRWPPRPGPGFVVGRGEWSSSPFSPCARQRAYHLARQRRENPASAATCAIGRPEPTRSHGRRRPSGVSGALGCPAISAHRGTSSECPSAAACVQALTLRRTRKSPVGAPYVPCARCADAGAGHRPVGVSSFVLGSHNTNRR